MHRLLTTNFIVMTGSLVFSLGANLNAAPGKIRVLIVEREWNEEITQAVFEVQPGPTKESLRIGGTLTMATTEDTNDYFANYGELRETYKAKFCDLELTAPLWFQPSVENHIDGFGPRAVPVKTSYTVKGPTALNLRLIKPGRSDLDYMSIPCK